MREQELCGRGWCPSIYVCDPPKSLNDTLVVDLFRDELACIFDVSSSSSYQIQRIVSSLQLLVSTVVLTQCCV